MTAIDHLLAETGRVDDPSDQSIARGRAVLDHALSDLPTNASTGHRRPILIGVAATAAAVVIIPVVSVGGGHAGVDARAATVLHQAGRAAAAQPGGWADAPYWHVASSYVRFGVTEHRDIWLAHDGISVLHDTGLPGHEGYVSLGRAEFDAGSTPLTWDELVALPTDTDQLNATLRADIKGAGNGDDSEVFTMVGDLLRESPAPPALRKALYDVAAETPGVHVKGQVVDAAGRSGTAIERDDQILVIDTSTGQLLADTEGGSFSATYLEQGPVDTAPAVTGK